MYRGNQVTRVDPRCFISTFHQPWVCLTGNNYKGEPRRKNRQDRKQWETKPPRNMPDRGSEYAHCIFFSRFQLTLKRTGLAIGVYQFQRCKWNFLRFDVRTSREKFLFLTLSLSYYHEMENVNSWHRDIRWYFLKVKYFIRDLYGGLAGYGGK